MVSADKIITELKARLSEKRLRHTLNVAECAKHLAKKYGADEEKAYLAGLLHDITKEESLENQLKTAEKYGIILDELFLASPQLIHPITGALVARSLGADEEIVKAVHEHTLGSTNMSTLSKCVWLADLIEPSRDFTGVDKLRELAECNLNAAIIAAMNRTVKYLEKTGETIHPGLIKARMALEAEKE